MKTRLAIAISLMVCVAPATSAATERTKLAVLDLKDKGVDKELVQSLTDVVTAALNRLEVFDVISRDEILRIVEFEQQKQLLGCDSESACLAEIGGALGVRALVTGSVGRVGTSYIIHLVLTDAQTAVALAREQREVAKVEELTLAIEGSTRFLVRHLLAGQQGDLVLTASELGADVEIDGRIAGVTPIARQTVSGGPHTLRVIKTGFVTWAKDIEIKRGEPLLVEAKLVPSLEFIRGYDQRATTWRLLSYTSAGIGLAAVSFGVGGWLWNGRRASDYERDLTAAHCRKDSGVGLPGTDCSALQSRRDAIRRFDTVAQAVGWVGVLAIGTGAYLFAQGPTPGLYEQYKGETEVAVSVLLGAGGVQMNVHSSF